MNTTITVSKKTKKLLEELKGSESWDSFLEKIAKEKIKKMRETAREELRKLGCDKVKFERAKTWARDFW